MWGKNLKVAAAEPAPSLRSDGGAEFLEARGIEPERKAAGFQRVVRDHDRQIWLLGFSLGPAQPRTISPCYSQVMSRMEPTTRNFAGLLFSSLFQ